MKGAGGNTYIPVWEREMLMHLRAGRPRTVAASSARVTLVVLNGMLRRDPQFREKVEAAEREFANKSTSNIRRGLVG